MYMLFTAYIFHLTSGMLCLRLKTTFDIELFRSQKISAYFIRVLISKISQLLLTIVIQNFRLFFRYKQLLTYIKSAVTKNHAEKSINSILDYISTSKQMELLQNFYETTLEALRDAKNERLWFKTMTKLGKLYYDRNFTCIRLIRLFNFLNPVI